MKPHKTILVVDDDPFVREAVCEFIQFIRPTWHTVEAANGQKGIDLAETVQPDLILTDLHMPVMNGYEMVVALQKKPQTRAIPLILNTSEDSGYSLVRQLKFVCQAVIFKPYLFDELDGVLEQIMPTQISAERNLPCYAATRHTTKLAVSLHQKYFPLNMARDYAYTY